MVSFCTGKIGHKQSCLPLERNEAKDAKDKEEALVGPCNRRHMQRCVTKLSFLTEWANS